MTKDEALKLALEALEEHHYGVAQIIIREALAQPEQEPVAWAVYEADGTHHNKPCQYPKCSYPCPDLPDCRDAQPEQEPVARVTYKEVADTMNGLWGGTIVQRQIAEELENTMLYTTPPQHKPDNEAYTALEQALTRLQKRYGELEAKVAAQQEPVAWGYRDRDGEITDCITPHEHDRAEGDYRIPLYTTSPPQRPWVGLTEERIKDIWLKGKDHGDDWLDVLALARSFEAELKEKNT